MSSDVMQNTRLVRSAGGVLPAFFLSLGLTDFDKIADT